MFKLQEDDSISNFTAGVSHDPLVQDVSDEHIVKTAQGAGINAFHYTMRSLTYRLQVPEIFNGNYLVILPMISRLDSEYYVT